MIKTTKSLLLSASLVAATAASAFAGGTYEARNLDLTGGVARVGRSGEPIFADRFECADAWAAVENYRGLLQVEIGREFAGRKTLFATRVAADDPNDPENGDTAWSATTVKTPISADLRGKTFALRAETRASKRIEGGGSDGAGWRGAARWFDESGELCAETPFLYRAAGDATFGEKIAVGTVPENAAAFEIRIGFDVPNLKPGEYAAVGAVELETIDESAAFGRRGSFVSGVFAGGRVSWDADVPDGCAVKFQIATADSLDEIGDGATALDALDEFVGPDGTSGTFFEEPFDANAPFVRYRAVLVPNAAGTATPTLKSVSVGDRFDANWTFGGDSRPPRVKIVGACGIPTRDVRAPLTVAIADESPIRWSTLKIEVDGTDETARFVRGDVDINDKIVLNGLPNVAATPSTLTPDADWAPGLHSVKVEIADALGNAVAASKVFLIGDAPTTPKITLRDDGTTLIDGEPFFPIGVYGVTEREFNGFDLDAAFAGLRDAGFNFAHSYSFPRTDKFLAAAEKYGFKLWTVAREVDERFVEIERRSPAILAWYLGDDTSANTTPSELYDRDDAVKAVDPTRISTQADPVDSGADVSNYGPYVAGTDAFLPEIYPVRKDDPRSGDFCVAQTLADTRRCRADAEAAGDGPKAIWPIIQYFQGWGWKRFPTNRELRAMSFAALAAGANGITWYTYGGTVEPELKKFNYGVTTSPDRWANISALATQIKELSPALLEPTDATAQPTAGVVAGPKTDPAGGPAIVALLKKRDGVNYLIAVDAAPETVKVRFDFPNGAPYSAKNASAPTIERLYDVDGGPTPAFGEKNGKVGFDDEFVGFGVRIYRWND